MLTTGRLKIFLGIELRSYAAKKETIAGTILCSRLHYVLEHVFYRDIVKDVKMLNMHRDCR